MSVTANGRQFYHCDYANHCVNIKNLLEYNPSYAKSVRTNEFFFPDTSRHAEETKYEIRRIQHVRNDAGNNWEERVSLFDVKENYNKGFAARKLLLALSAEVNCEIPLNRYSYLKNFKTNFFPT